MTRTHRWRDHMTRVRFPGVDYRHADRLGMHDEGSSFILHGRRSAGRLMDQIKKRKRGVPRLVGAGFLEQRIENELQYEKIEERFLALVKVSASVGIWDDDEVCYIPLSALP